MQREGVAGLHPNDASSQNHTRECNGWALPILRERATMQHPALQDPHPSHQVILESDISVAVLGRGKEFYLVRLDGSETVADALDVARRNDYTYCGVIGVKDGVPKAQIEPDPDSLLTMAHAGLEFAAIIAEDLKKHQMDAAFCERLYALPDTRPAQ